jgi:hypothetical protein
MKLASITRPRTWIRAAFVAASLIAASASPARAAVSATDRTPDACKLLTEAEAAAVLGKPVKVKPNPKPTVENHVECSWETESSFIKIRLETDAILQAYKDHQTVEPRFNMMLDEVKKKKAREVPGLGAPAVWSDFHQLWVMKPGRMITVEVNRKARFTPGDDLAGAKAVAEKALGRL